MRPKVKYLVIYRHKDKYSISEMCRIFKVSRSGYYDFVKRMEIPDKDLPLAQLIEECQQESKKTYGYRRVSIWLDKRGVHHNPIHPLLTNTRLFSIIHRNAKFSKTWIRCNKKMCLSHFRYDAQKCMF